MTVRLNQLQLFCEDAADSSVAIPKLRDMLNTAKKREFLIEAMLDDASHKKSIASILKQLQKHDPNAKISIKQNLSNTPWLSLPFLCIDTETSGLDRSKDRVVEVAWLLFHDESILESDARLCKIDTPLDPEIVKLTGIDDSMLKDQPPFETHVDALFAALSQVAFVVAYNAGFDKAFIEAELRRAGKTLPDLPWVDPCVFIREIDKYRKGKKLSDATARWGIELKDAHRALSDAKACGLLLYKLAPHLKAKTLDELMQMQQKWQADQERDYKAYVAKNSPFPKGGQRGISPSLGDQEKSSLTLL